MRLPSNDDLGRLPELVAAVRAGSPRAVGRMISMIENGSAQLPRLMAELAGHVGTFDELLTDVLAAH